jgi:hypothetical protein
MDDALLIEHGSKVDLLTVVVFVESFLFFINSLKIRSLFIQYYFFTT